MRERFSRSECPRTAVVINEEKSEQMDENAGKKPRVRTVDVEVRVAMRSAPSDGPGVPG